MNKEIEKAMNKKEHKIVTWYKNNSYKIWRIILFPIWFFSTVNDKIAKKKYKNLEWDKTRADKILTRYMLRESEWNEKEKSFYFWNNGWYISSYSGKKATKRKDHKFCSKYKFELKEYLLNEFELEGFTKIIDDCDYGCIEITFKLNEKDS